MGLRIFACADLHMGMKFSRYPEKVRTSLVDARSAVLSRMVEKANEASCDLFFIAGDLFDRPNPPKKLILEAVKALQRFEGRLAVLLPGNHDYFIDDPGSLWDTLAREAGDRVLIAVKDHPMDLSDFDVPAVLYPGVCTEKHSSRNSIEWIAKEKKDPRRGLSIGLAHGSLEGLSPDFDGRYFPMTTADLDNGGLDLWIIGHTHLQYSRHGKATLFVPGTPEPDGFDCRADGTAWIIDWDGAAGITAETVSTGCFRFLDAEVRVVPGRDPVKDISALDLHNPSGLLFRLRLKGIISAGYRESLEEYIGDLGKTLFYLHIDDGELALEITADEIDAGFQQGSFPHLLLTELGKLEDPVLLNFAWSLIREASV